MLDGNVPFQSRAREETGGQGGDAARGRRTCQAGD